MTPSKAGLVMTSSWVDSGNDYDTLNGWNGNDTLNGENGNDSLKGELGNDSLDGGNGNDSLNGGVGDDLLVGGEGSDRFIYSKEWIVFDSGIFGVDVIFDFQTGTDKIVLNKTTFNSISSPISTGLSGSQEFAIVTSDANAATREADIVYNSVNGKLFYNPNGSDSGFGTGALFATLTGAPTLVATDFILEASPLSLSGSNENDFLVGEEMADYLSGNDGNDSLVGGDGDDTLYGGYGNDSLVGGDGDDYLYGDDGNDFLVGGEGSDRFHAVYERIFNSEYFGVDVISDFETGSDKIALNKSIFTSINSFGGTGFSLSEEFAVVESDADAAISTAEIVYNSSNGNLYYNTNGSEPGLGTGSLFATLTGVPTLVATDFLIFQPYYGEE
jgi:Ca2+-binding RTX toxin-like protein